MSDPHKKIMILFKDQESAKKSFCHYAKYLSFISQANQFFTREKIPFDVVISQLKIKFSDTMYMFVSVDPWIQEKFKGLRFSEVIIDKSVNMTECQHMFLKSITIEVEEK